jgi:hypothetical protein
VHRCFREKVCAAAAAEHARNPATETDTGFRRVSSPFSSSDVIAAAAFVDETRAALTRDSLEVSARLLDALKAQKSAKNMRRAAARRASRAAMQEALLAAAVATAAAAVSSSGAFQRKHRVAGATDSYTGSSGAGCGAGHSSRSSVSDDSTSSESDHEGSSVDGNSSEMDSEVSESELPAEVLVVHRLLLRHYRLQWELDECAADSRFLKVRKGALRGSCRTPSLLFMIRAGVPISS